MMMMIIVTVLNKRKLFLNYKLDLSISKWQIQHTHTKKKKQISKLKIIFTMKNIEKSLQRHSQ